MQKGKYYIEFVGQHTAGKTTLIKKIVDQGLLAPKNALYPQKIQRSKITFFLQLPILLVQNVAHLVFVIGFLLRYTKLNWINYHAAARHLLKMVLLHPYFQRYDFDLWMKDDMLHLLPRLEFRKGVTVEAALREFFMHFSYLYDGIVYIDLPYETMKERFDARFKDRPSARRANRAPVYERAFTQTEILKRILTQQKEVPVLVLSGTDDIQENVERIVTFIESEVYEK